MTSKECLKRIDERNYSTQREHEEFLSIIEKELKALEIIKEYLFVFVENGQLKSGRYADIEILLDESDFETKEEYELLKEVLED